MLDVYRTQFKATIATQLQYRVALMIWLIYTVIEPTIFLVAWAAVARATGGRVGGYSPEEFAAYYIVSMWVGHLSFTWVMHDMEFRIRQGQFSPKLLRPIHPIHADIAENISYKALTVVVLGPATVGMVLAFEPRANPQPWALVALVPALFLAFVLRFASGWTLALAAFWTTRVNAINQLYFSTFMFLSGTMFPLSLLPGWLVPFTWALPFRWQVAFPVELALGRLTPVDAAVGLGMQALWALLTLVVLDRVWRRAVRQYTAVGA